MPNNLPGIVLIEHQETDIAIPKDENIKDKEMEKIVKYQPLKIELKRLGSKDYNNPNGDRRTWSHARYTD